MTTINFRDKNLSKLEAIISIFNLKVGFISSNLNEQEKKEYEAQKGLRDYFNSLSKKPENKEFSEKDYLIERLRSEIRITKLVEKREYCKKYGHISNPQYLINGTKSFNICRRCKMSYTRGLTTKESKSFYDMIHRPFTI